MTQDQVIKNQLARLTGHPHMAMGEIVKYCPACITLLHGADVVHPPSHLSSHPPVKDRRIYTTKY